MRYFFPISHVTIVSIFGSFHPSLRSARVYIGSGGGTANLYSYLPLTPETNNDQKVSLAGLVMLAQEYGIDPPEEQIATSSPAPINPLMLALVATAAIALAATVYKLERKKISKP